MTESSRRAVELLLAEANRFLTEARYADLRRGAEGAAAAARAVGDLGLEICAVRLEAAAHMMLGDKATALQRLTWILTVAADPHRRDALVERDVTWYIAQAHMDWVECARFLPEIPAADLFRVVDAGEAYLRAVGQPSWRVGLLSVRARVLATLGRQEEAVAPAEEAVALKLGHPGTPGSTLATYRWSLGNLLRDVGRIDDAERQYRDVLSDAGSEAYDRYAAHQGLGWCAIRRSDSGTARQEADAATQLSEGMGDEVLSLALALLVEACRAGGDRLAAHRAAERGVKAARRTGSEYPLYYALRYAADVALDEEEAGTARALLDEAAPLGDRLDRQSGQHECRAEIAQRRERLARLDATR